MADINQLKEQVRDANDIVDVIGSYISLKKSGSNYMGLCPFHGEKTPSFSVSPTYLKENAALLCSPFKSTIS